jgi:hypothetical protein
MTEINPLRIVNIVRYNVILFPSGTKDKLEDYPCRIRLLFEDNLYFDLVYKIEEEAINVYEELAAKYTNIINKEYSN